jgi:hypothetical protein
VDVDVEVLVAVEDAVLELEGVIVLEGVVGIGHHIILYEFDPDIVPVTEIK